MGNPGVSRQEDENAVLEGQSPPHHIGSFQLLADGGLRSKEGENPMSANEEAWWSKTKNLMWISMVIWFLAGYVIHVFVQPLNEIVIFGFPLGFYMAAQGSLIIFVVQIFWFSSRQDAIDREHGVAEDD